MYCKVKLYYFLSILAQTVLKKDNNMDKQLNKIILCFNMNEMIYSFIGSCGIIMYACFLFGLFLLH